MNNISFIVPVYNIETSKIGRCFKSIYSQINEKDEIIFIDDGSTVDIADFLDTLVKNNVIIIHQLNGGTASARNNGLENAKNEWIIFVDPDDWIKENTIEEVRKSLDSNNDIYLYDYYGTSDCIAIKKYCFFTMNTISKEDIYRSLLCDTYFTDGVDCIINCGVPWAHVYKKSFLEINDLKFDTRFRREEDTFFTMHAASKTNKIEIVHFAFYIYWCSHCFGYYGTFKRNALDYLPLEAKEMFDFHYNEHMSKEIYRSLIGYNYSILRVLLFSYIINPLVKEDKEKRRYLKFMRSYEAFKIIYKGKKYLSFKDRIVLFLYRTNQLWILKRLLRLKKIAKKMLKNNVASK